MKLLDTEAWGMGGSGTPIPSPALIDDVIERYNPTAPLFPGQPLFEVSKVNPLFTPEGLYPITGVKSLPLDTSVAQGVSILNSTITSQIAGGNNLVVVGGSQSSTIASLEMRELLALPKAEQPTADQLSFLLLVDPSAPNGGLLERFNLPDLNANLPPLTGPSFGVTFSGATPSDTPWDTAVYDMEYDGFSDFPRYPIDLPADLNAALGIVYVHSTVTTIPLSQVAEAVKLPVSDDYTGHTQYFMIPVENLPLLDPLRGSPMGNAIADLLQPDLKVLVNLGYGSITDGWDPGPANVPTPIGLFPTNLNPADVLTALANGAQEGVKDFVHDLGSLSTQSISEATTNGASVTIDSLSSLTDIVNAFSSVAAASYAALLPVADAVNALVTTLPAYDASLFTQELASGNLLDAIGLPIAADFGLTPIAALFGVAGIAGIVDAIPS
ncbi:MAG: PE-PPE domain-containing protein [Mycobacterium sp.]